MTHTSMARGWVRRSRAFRARGILQAVLGAAAALYIGACAGAMLTERSFTYKPDPTYSTPAAAGLSGVSERWLNAPNGDRILAWVAPAKPGQPTILYFHGNGDPLTYRAGRVKAFQAEGYGVFMIAYPGFAGSTGTPTEKAIRADARMAYDTLRADGVPAKDIVIYGESLGTSVAVLTAVERPEAAVILEAPFTSMVAAWRQFVPWLPVNLLLKDRWDSLRAIKNLRSPLLVMHGDNDRLVNIRLGRKLYEAAPGPKRFVEFAGATHTTIYDHGGIDAVHKFIADVRAGKKVD